MYTVRLPWDKSDMILVLGSYPILRMHMHTGSSPAWGTVHTEPLASLFTLSFFVLSHQCLKMCVLGVDVET